MFPPKVSRAGVRRQRLPEATGKPFCVNVWEEAGAVIAHLKMTLTPDTGNDLAVANLVRSEGTVELSHELAEVLDHGHLILNLRAEADPRHLREAVLEELEAEGSHKRGSGGGRGTCRRLSGRAVRCRRIGWRKYRGEFG